MPTRRKFASEEERKEAKREACRKYYYATLRFRQTERMRKYRQTPEGKAAVLRSVKNYEARNPERKKAWDKAKYLPKQPCEQCGTASRIHKHHPDPAKPLEVVYLCAYHHVQEHKASPSQLMV